MGSRRAPGSGRRRLLWCLVVLATFSTPAAQGRQAPPPPRATDTIGRAQLAEEAVGVLGGRLTVWMPEGARSEARPIPIMGAPESEEHETRVVYDAGPERLVLMVHETFALAGDDFPKDVKDWVARWKGTYVVEPLSLPVRGLKAVVVRPAREPDHNRSGDATFVEGLFVQSEDRTIQSLDVFVNAAGERDLKGCKAVARQILLSLAPGKKPLRLDAGERRLYAYAKDLEISVTVPRNTVATRQFGPDFLVHRLIPLGRLGADSGSVLIYVGGAPDYEPGPKKGEGVLFGKKVEWRAIPQEEGLQTLCTLAIPGQPDRYAHVIIRARTEAQIKTLRATAESLKLVKAQGPPAVAMTRAALGWVGAVRDGRSAVAADAPC